MGPYQCVLRSEDGRSIEVRCIAGSTIVDEWPVISNMASCAPQSACQIIVTNCRRDIVALMGVGLARVLSEKWLAGFNLVRAKAIG